MCGSKTTKSTTNQSTTALAPYASAYQNILSQGQTLADNSTYNPAMDKQVAGFTSPQTQAFGNVQSGLGGYQPYMDQANAFTQQGGQAITGADIQARMNPYQQAVIDQTQAQFDRQNTRQLNDVSADAAKRGAFYGSGKDVAEALTREQQANTQNPVIAGLYQSGFNNAQSAAQQDAARALQAGSQYGSLGGLQQQYGLNDVNALLGIGGMQQQLNQSQLDAASGNAAQRDAYGRDNLSWLASLATGVGGAAGSTSTGTSTQKTPGPSPLQIGLGLATAAAGFAEGGAVQPEGYNGYRIQQPQIKSTSPAQAPSLGSVSAPATDDDGGFGAMMGKVQQGHSLMKGLGNLTNAATSQTGEGGWTTSVRPESASGFGNFIGNKMSGLGSMFGFAEGGAVDRNPFEDIAMLGSDVMTPERPAPTPAPLVAPSQGGGLSAVPQIPAKQERMGGLNLLGLSDPARQGLIAAGLGMLGSESPNWFGQGGMKGLGAYQGARDAEADAANKRWQMEHQAAELQQRAAEAAERMRQSQAEFPLDQKIKQAQIDKYNREATARETDPAKMTPEQRGALAVSQGMKPGSPEYQAFVLAGKFLREDQQRLTSTDKKAVMEADEMVQANQGVIRTLETARELSAKANQGWGAGARATIGNNLPDWLVPDAVSSPESSEATANLDNAVIGQALQQLKSIFGGMPSEGERKILLDLQGSSSLPHSVRMGIYDRAKKLAEQHLQFNQEKANALRGGEYYKPGGQPGAAAGSHAKVTNAEEYAALPAGTPYIDPEGNQRTKQ